MDCFYTPREYIGASDLRVAGSEFHHISRVMRKAPGDELYVTSGEGVMYKTVITETGRDAVQCKIIERLHGFGEPGVEIVLVQALLKNPGKIDFIVEKATELGVSRIVPVLTERTIAKGGKVDRWRSLALAAMKQCGRSLLPAVDDSIPLDEAVNAMQSGIGIMCDEGEDETNPIERVLKHGVSGKPVVVYIGPEGGFTSDELTMMESRGARLVSLGARRLRSETAAIVALARVAAALESTITHAE